MHVVSPKAEEVPESGESTRVIDQLTAAFDQGHWQLHRQEIVPLEPAKGPVYWEVLLRLRDGQELAGPEKFMRAAERYKMMSRLDLHVTRLAFQHLSNCPVDERPLITFINLSVQTVDDELFLHRVQGLLEEYEQDPGSICFELTEAAITQRGVAAISFLVKLKKMGFKIALDDFGAGSSSYEQLKQVPLDFIKIDGALVRNLNENRFNQLIVRSMSDVAHKCKIQTVAKFVESAEVLETLNELGTGYAQGYALSYPSQLSDTPSGEGKLAARDER